MASTHAAAGGAGAAVDERPRVSGLGIFSWILYEWAATPFYTLVITFLFAPYFADAFIGDPARGQYIWGFAAGFAGLCVAIISPVLGAMADASGRRKPWVLVSSLFFVAGMSALWIAAPGRVDLLWLVLAAFVVAAVTAEVNAVFINAIMPKLVSPQRLGTLSGIGAAVGYAGGLASLFLMAGFIAVKPETGKTLLGLDPILHLDIASRESDRLVGPFAAAWFVLFALPFFLFTPDPRSANASATPVRDGLRNLGETAREIRGYSNIVRFLIARMLYQDGLGGVFTFAGIYAVSSFGWSLLEKAVFGIILSAAAMLGAAFSGFIEDKTGPKAVIMGALVIAIVATLGVLSIDGTHIFFTREVVAKVAGSPLFSSMSEIAFIGFAILVGMVAGPLYSSSRSLMARISPPEKVTEFFGLFAFSGKATSFIAPSAIGLMTALTGSQRLGVAVVLVFIGIGFLLMLTVKTRPSGEVREPRFPRPGNPRSWGERIGQVVVLLISLAAIAFLLIG